MAAARSQSEREETFEVGLKAITEICPIAGLPSLDYGPEAMPIPDSNTETCARALIRHWIARFGTPTDIASDRGAQFTSDLWKELTALFGTQRNTTTAYHF